MSATEQYSVAHAANGNTSVTCTLTEASLTVKWTVRSFPSCIADGARQAQAGAYEALVELQEAVRGERPAA